LQQSKEKKQVVTVAEILKTQREKQFSDMLLFENNMQSKRPPANENVEGT